MPGIDFVACVDCGHMIRVSNIDLHEMSECMAIKPDNHKKQQQQHRNNSPLPSVAGSSVSSGSSGSSEDDRRLRLAARLDACKAQAQAMGKIENCLAVDFEQDVYAPFHVAPSPVAYQKEQDYVAVARAAGRIEDCRGEVAQSLYFKKKQQHNNNNGPAVTTIDDKSMPSGSPWMCPECSVDNDADTHQCTGCQFSNTALEQFSEGGARFGLLDVFKISPTLTVIGSVVIGCAVGYATSVLKDRPLAESVVQGAMVGYFAGGFMAGVL